MQIIFHCIAPLLGGMLPCASCNDVGLRWWAGVSLACVPSLVSCSSFGLPVHAQPPRHFVTTSMVFHEQYRYIGWGWPALLQGFVGRVKGFALA